MFPAPCPRLPQTLQKPSPELKQQLTGHSKRVAGSVTELIQAAEAMKGEGATRGREGRETLVPGRPLLPVVCSELASDHSPHRCQGPGASNRAAQCP